MLRVDSPPVSPAHRLTHPHRSPQNQQASQQRHYQSRFGSSPSTPSTNVDDRVNPYSHPTTPTAARPFPSTPSSHHNRNATQQATTSSPMKNLKLIDVFNGVLTYSNAGTGENYAFYRPDEQSPPAYLPGLTRILYGPAAAGGGC